MSEQRDVIATIGHILPGAGPRDAIHIPIIPVQAGEDLSPGDRVSMKNGVALRGWYGDVMGGVDPYLRGRVNKGKWFWLFLRPGQVEGMRHHWKHKALGDDDPIPPVSKEASEKWLREYAASISMPFDELMLAAREWIEYGSYKVERDSTVWQDSFEPLVFWHHYEQYTGTKVERKGNFFSCSC